jgi:hypothetical protein
MVVDLCSTDISVVKCVESSIYGLLNMYHENLLKIVVWSMLVHDCM